MSDVCIHVYTVCWNEEKILPYFLEHYSRFADRIVVYDNMSTDRSAEIVRAHPAAELRLFDTGDRFDDKANLHIKNTAYRESAGIADFVIAVDTDELVYHPDIKALLAAYREEGVTLPKMTGFEMISLSFPRRPGSIIGQIRLGRENPFYNKRCIFSPELEMNFLPGCHVCTPEGVVRESRAADLKLLHFHYVGLLKTVVRHKVCKKRLSRFNIDTKAGYQYTWGSLKIIARFLVYRVNAHDIIRNRRSLLSSCAAPLMNGLVRLFRAVRPESRWNY